MLASMCDERDGWGQRCTIVGPHKTITNSKGQRAVAHETPTSMWSVPVVAVRLPPQPRSSLR